MNNIISKIIHQIWIGPNPEPTNWTNTFKIDYIKMYPEYKYIRWSESNIDELFTDFPIIKIVYDLEETYNGKSDILRYLILYSYGGIYIDADSVWVNEKNFDNLINDSNGFFAAKEPNCEHITGGVIGSYKNNNVFLKIIKHIESYILNKDGKIIIKSYINKRKIIGASKTIGPIIFDNYAKNTNITIFPSEYFYPFSWHGITDPELHLKIKLPEQSYMFQYGYTTNSFNLKI
jgi:mannosyltransferase OCH1-like enzyme